MIFCDYPAPQNRIVVPPSWIEDAKRQHLAGTSCVAASDYVVRNKLVGIISLLRKVIRSWFDRLSTNGLPQEYISTFCDPLMNAAAN
jgi:hypothetical protein